MTAALYIKRSGVWATFPATYRRENGVWYVRTIYTKRSGAWIAISIPPAPPPAPPAPGPLTASASPSPATASIVGSGTVTSPLVTVTAGGGTAPYTYSWAVSSGPAMTINNPTSNATTFTGTVTAGQSLNSMLTCTVRDNLSVVKTVSVNVILSATYVGISGSISPSSVSASRSGAGSAETGSASVSISGGSGSYAYAWSIVSGDSVSITNPNSASTTFSALLNNGQTLNSVYKCVATSTDGQSTTLNVNVSLMSSYVNPITAYITPSPNNSTRTRLPATSRPTPACTCYASGSSGYTYAWTQLSGDFFTINTPNSSTTTFSTAIADGDVSNSGTFRCTVTDAFGNVQTADVTVLASVQ